MTDRTYIVTITNVHRVAGQRPSETLEIVAKNAKEAIKSARKAIWQSGHTRQDGALHYTAQRKQD